MIKKILFTIFAIFIIVTVSWSIAHAGALVDELSDADQNVDGRAAQLVMGVQFGRVDADTVIPVAIAADGAAVADVTIVGDEVGLATSAKQLPDGHNVTVDNVATDAVPSLVTDSSGNPIDSHMAGDGGYHLGVNATISGEQNAERHAWLNALGDQMIAPRYRLVGTAFDGTDKDTNFWTETIANGGSVTQAGGLVELKTSVAVDGSAQYDSDHRARFVAGAPQIFTGLADWETVATVGNIRRIGAYDDNDGFFFELGATTFSVGSRKGAVDALVSTGSFNGNYGVSWTPTAGTAYKLDIEFLPTGVFWYVNNKLLHKIGLPHLTNTLTLPIRIENVKTSGAVDIAFHTSGMLIAREGQLITNPISKYQSGTVAELILKYGAGTLRGIVISNVSNTAVINLYDSITAAVPLIWSSGTMAGKTEPASIDFFGLPFSTGLTLEVATANCDVLVIYE